MGAFSGGISFTKYYVRGEPPKRLRESFMRGLRLRTFQPLSPEEEAEEGVGWCQAGNPLKLEFTPSDVFWGSYLAIGIRLDRWRIPRPLLKAQLAEAVGARLERTGKEKLSRREQDELKFQVTRRLRKKVLPAMRAFDVVWNLETGVLRFWNRSPRVKEELETLFEQTFKLRLDEASPYFEAQQLVGDSQALVEVEESSFSRTQEVPGE